MSRTKKIVLSLSLVFTMLVALVIGFAIPKSSKPSTSNDSAKPSVNSSTIVEKPRTYTYNAGDVVIKKGLDTINYQYDPSLNMGEDAPKTTAYEYVFGNPKNVTTAVHLYSINGEGVNISYAYSTSPIDTTKTITGETTYTTQTIAVGENSYKYIYVLVTPTDGAIPIDFTANVIWTYGNARPLTITTNVEVTVGETTTNTIDSSSVDGQILEAPLPPVAPENHYFDAWFLDSDYTQLATFPIATTKLYARFHNIPFGNTQIFAYEGTPDDDTGSYRFHTSYNGSVEEYLLNSRDVIIPTIYNDGVNGEAFVTSIGGYAFYDDLLCESVSLNSISMPYTIESIGQMAFYGCVGLQNVTTLPKNLTTISSQAFIGTDLQSLDLSSCTNLTTIEGSGAGAFESCSNLTNVVLPNSLTILNWGTFEGCGNLTSVTLPNNLTDLGLYAFKGCSNLSSIILPNSLTGMGHSVFDGCSSLTSIAIPSGVTSIPNNAFKGCVALESVNLSACTSLTSIGASAFRNCSSLKHINIPKNVTSIGANAFDSCSSLTSVLLPKGLTTLGNYAFNKCSALESLNLNDCASLTSIPDYAFCNCKKWILDLDVSRFTSIGTYAFYYCSKLTGDLVFNPSLTIIKESTFESCGGLTSLDFSNCANLTELSDYAFESCSGLTNLNVRNCSKLDIGVYTFGFCTSLKELDLRDCISITYFSYGAFSDCSNLLTIIIPSSVNDASDNDAFANCCRLVEIYNLSSNLEITGDASCYSGLGRYAKVIHTSLDNPSRIQTIGNVQYYVYEDDFIAIGTTSPNVTTITLDSRTTSINDYAFYNCSGLTSITLPSSLISIGGYAFYNCSGLTSITLPSSLISIGGYAFWKCKALTSLTFEADGTWYYGTQAQQEAMDGGTRFEIMAGTDYKSTFIDTYSTYSKYWYKK